MRTSRTVAAVAACAIALNSTGAAVAFDRFIDEDEIVMEFEGKKAGKLENIRWQLNGVKLGAETVLAAKSRALVMSAVAPNAFGVGRLPFLGAGEFSFSLTLGFLGAIGLSSSSIAAIEIDIPFDSSPLLFYFLAVRALGSGLEVSLNDQNGVVGSPVVLADTRLARLRMKQTATELIFDARSILGGPWINVATLALAVTFQVFQLSFGAALLNPGALVMFDDLRASGGIFGPTEAFHLLVLYALLADLALAREAIVHQTNLSLALTTLLAFQNALLLAAAGIQTDFGQFLAFTQVALALKHLKTAGREAGKVEKPLTRGRFVDALERLARAEAFLQLATLALRGMNARKIDELCYFLGGKGFKPTT